ncbi:hypothetical protein ACFOU2_07200 [Bacillus songklensis]|uniref:Uncharacterized protein n=1 Tax=Bacillus songklensis TaxID=1069116 RepID=A0ABV8B2B1_9BACI
MRRPFISQLKIRNLQLYLFIVIFPSMIISVLFTQLITNQLEAEQTEHAKRTAYFHKNYVDRFIRETVTRIETIALTSNPEKESYQYIESILARAHQKDLRLSGLYFCDIKGNMLFGSHPLQKKNQRL